MKSIKHKTVKQLITNLDRTLLVLLILFGFECLYTFAQTLGLTLFEKTPIKELFNVKNLINNLSDENQLSLWDS
jgi:hypothetical protein